MKKISFLLIFGSIFLIVTPTMRAFPAEIAPVKSELPEMPSFNEEIKDMCDEILELVENANPRVQKEAERIVKEVNTILERCEREEFDSPRAVSSQKRVLREYLREVNRIIKKYEN